jgi:hypothetical protein
MWSAWWILWALTCQIHVVARKHQAAINSSMNNCGTKHMIMLPTSKLNSSDSQVSGQVSFCFLYRRGCYVCEVLSHQNCGASVLQLEGFYAQMSSSLLPAVQCIAVGSTTFYSTLISKDFFDSSVGMWIVSSLNQPKTLYLSFPWDPQDITFLSPLRGSPSSTVASRVTP